MTSDRIEKTVLLRAPLPRVWDAIADARQFGTWFGVDFDGPFVAGAELTGKIIPTSVDPLIAKLQEPHRGKAFAFVVEQIAPMRRIAFRWHPFAVEPGVDYAAEPSTLIEFVLAEEDGGVRLTISESGFDQIPLERRAKAFAANEGGWEMQTQLIGKYLALPASARA